MYSYEPLHMAEQKQDDQLEHTYSSYVRIRDVALKTCQRRWIIGRSGERGSEISVLAARHDDIYIYIYMRVCVCGCVWLCGCVCLWILYIHRNIYKIILYIYIYILHCTVCDPGFHAISNRWAEWRSLKNDKYAQSFVRKVICECA